MIKKIQISDITTAVTFLKPLDAKKNNWETWSDTILLALQLVQATGIVDGSTPKPNVETDPDAVDIWNYNDIYIKMLIRGHVADSELMHIRSSQTSRQMWDTLQKLHQLTTYQIFTDKLRVFQEIKAKNGDNIPDHLMKLKKQWEEVQYFRKELNRKAFDDSFLKQQIVVSLPRSWDSYTSNYVKSFVDDDDADVDAKKRIDSNELIGTITQEYNLTNLRKTEKSSSPPKGENSRSSLADRMDNQNSNSTSGFYEGKRKKQCRHCSLTGHLVSQCKFLGQNRCRKCNRFGHDADQCPQPRTQSSDLKRKGDNNTGNSGKRTRTEAQNANADANTSQSANVATRGELNNKHAEDDDGLIDVLSDAESEIISPCVRSQNNKPFDLYDWLADTGTTSHITHRRDAFATYEMN